jgi:hypothetical protein
MTGEPITPDTPPVAIRVIPKGKRALSANGQPKRTPLNKAGLVSPLAGALGAPTKQTRLTRAIPKDPSRQSIEHQIASLNDSIRKTLREVVSLVRSGHVEKAVFTCGLVATKQNRILALVDQYARAQDENAIPAVDPVTKPKTKTVRARKTYKTWSDK